MTPSSYSRPPWLIASAAATLVLAAAFVVLALLSLTSGHGQFSGQVAAMLLAWGLLVGAAGWALWRLLAWARGAVVAAGLLHLFSLGQMIPTAPWAAAGALLAAVAVVGAVLPGTRRALSRER